MHAILATLGTDGDVLPYVGLGSVLRSRGHRVTLATAGDYRALAAERGFEFAPLLSEAENRRVLGDPDFWHPLKGAWVAARWGIDHLDRHYAVLRELSAPGDSVLIASPAILPARLLNEQFGRPLASVILQPWMIVSSVAPPVMPAGLTLPRWAPSPVGAMYWRTVDAAGDWLVGRRLNRLRATLGLPPVRRLFRWWISPELVLGMFPGWYGPAQKDWAKQIRLAGFPRVDRGAAERLGERVARFCDEGEPPVAFTFGTGMMHAGRLFRSAVEACGILSVRGILLTRYPQGVPPDLPASILHCEYAPFRGLFPRCAAVVHHGGIGTVAAALAAGTPQLILPMAFDQLDNATRVKRLGAGDFIRAARASGPRIAQGLKAFVGPSAVRRCHEIAFACNDRNGLDIAADHIEQLANSSSVAGPVSSAG